VTLGGSDLSDATWRMVGVKSGQLLRLLGSYDVTALSIDHLQGYIETRLGEGAATETIRKELSVLRQVLKLAHERGKLRHGPRLLFPRFRAGTSPGSATSRRGRPRPSSSTSPSSGGSGSCGRPPRPPPLGGGAGRLA
jgi:hypothetical protein